MKLILCITELHRDDLANCNSVREEHVNVSYTIVNCNYISSKFKQCVLQ